MELKALINTERKEGWGQSKKAKTRKNECQDRRTRRLNKCTFLLLFFFFKLYDCTDNITRVYDNSLHTYSISSVKLKQTQLNDKIRKFIL